MYFLDQIFCNIDLDTILNAALCKSVLNKLNCNEIQSSIEPQVAKITFFAKVVS